MIKIAICDDKTEILKNLYVKVKLSFSRYTDDFTIEYYTDGLLLINQHRIESYDIVFLDIDMPRISGFDVANEIRNQLGKCLIIFVTSFKEYVFKSFDFQPFHFIPKDENIDSSINSVVDKIMRHMKQNAKIILEDNISGTVAVYIRDIKYIQSNKHYANFHIADKPQAIQMRYSLSEIERAYSDLDFIRIHKSFIVNLQHILSVDAPNNEVVLKDDTKLPLSRNFKAHTNKLFQQFLRSRI